MVRWCVVLVDCNFVLEVARPPPIKIGWLSYTKRLSLRLSRLAHAFVQARSFKQGTLITDYNLTGTRHDCQSCERALKQALQGYNLPRASTPLRLQRNACSIRKLVLCETSCLSASYCSVRNQGSELSQISPRLSHLHRCPVVVPCMRFILSAPGT